MTDQRQTPTFRDLSENKQDIKVWVAPSVKRRLSEMADDEGKGLSTILAPLLTVHAYPELGGQILKYAKAPEPERGDGVPRFETVDQFERWLVSEGIVANAEDARAVSELAKGFISPAAGGR